MSASPLNTVHRTPPDRVPPNGWAGPITTLTLGKVSGELVRSIYDDTLVSHDTRITIAGDNTPHQIDDPQTLRDLAQVAAALADELAAAQGR